MRKLIFILLIKLSIIGCKNIKNSNLNRDVDLPNNYKNNKANSENAVKLRPYTFFKDTNLIKLINESILNNYDLKIALEKINILNYNFKSAKGDIFPKIDLTLSSETNKYAKYTEEYAGNSTTDFEGKIIPNPINSNFVGLSSSWEIDVWGKLRNKKKSAYLNYLASIEGKNFVISNLVSSIAILYYELLALDKELEIIRQTIQKQKEAIEAINHKKESGRVNELALQQFKAQLTNIKVIEKEKEKDIVRKENKINYLVGRTPIKITRNKEYLFEKLSITDIGLPINLLENRPDIRNALFDLESSDFELKSNRAYLLPSLNINAVLGFQSFNAGFLFNSPSSIGFNLLGGIITPIINRRQINFLIKTTKSKQLINIYKYKKTILSAYLEVEEALQNINYLKDIEKLQINHNEILEKSFIISKEFYSLAKANYLEVLITQQNYLESNLKLIDTRKRKQIEKVRLYKSLGGGWI